MANALQSTGGLAQAWWYDTVHAGYKRSISHFIICGATTASWLKCICFNVLFTVIATKCIHNKYALFRIVLTKL